MIKYNEDISMNLLHQKVDNLNKIISKNKLLNKYQKKRKDKNQS